MSPLPSPRAVPSDEAWDPTLASLLLVTEEDLSPEFLLDQGLRPAAIAVLTDVAGRSPLAVADHVHRFTAGAITDTLDRLQARNAPVFTDEAAVLAFAERQGASQIVTPYAPVGPVASRLTALSRQADARGMTLRRVLRDHDRQAWPHASHGFFRFREAVMG
jgi:deoxyribodipyrimidine photo-lyase